MRQNQFSGWLTQFAEENYKKIEASYFDHLKQLIEKQSEHKYATIDDAIDDFCKRLSLDRPSKEILTAKLIASLETIAIADTDVSPFEKKIQEIEKEKNYPIKRKEDDQTKSQIAREVNLEVGDQLGKGVGTTMNPNKMSKLKGLSLKV